MPKDFDNLIQLTNRESQVLYLVSLGFSAKEAAIELDISPCTVERHVENVRLKTRTRNRAHMIAHVIREAYSIPTDTATCRSPLEPDRQSTGSHAQEITHELIRVVSVRS